MLPRDFIAPPHFFDRPVEAHFKDDSIRANLFYFHVVSIFEDPMFVMPYFFLPTSIFFSVESDVQGET